MLFRFPDWTLHEVRVVQILHVAETLWRLFPAGDAGELPEVVSKRSTPGAMMIPTLDLKNHRAKVPAESALYDCF